MTFTGYYLRKSTAIHVLNVFDYNLMKSYYKVNEKKIFLIPLGVDTNIFRPLDVLREDSKLKILFLGKIDEQKGFDILCTAINQLSALSEFNQMSFTLVGTGKWSAVADNLAQTFPNVVHLNFVPQEDIVNLYNSHDVFVLPSRWETISYVCLEAQSCGLPVIVTNIPGPNGIIKHNKNGLLIPSEDSIALSKAILYMNQMKKDSPSAFEKMKTYSRVNTEELFSLKLEAERLTELFETVSCNGKAR